MSGTRDLAGRGRSFLPRWWLATALVTSLPLAACQGGGPAPDGAEAYALPANRLFDGAPPTIPHEVAALGRHDCLGCHRDGDALAGGAMAPITPHPELERCAQCHVVDTGAAPFVASDHGGGWTYPVGQLGQPMGPPLIPHPLTMRESCLGCHGPDGTTVAELRTSHPERLRCQQCHVPANEGWPGPRPHAR